MESKKLTRKEILKQDFYDFVGICDVFMTDDDKVIWYRENIESRVKPKSHPENFCNQCGSKNPTWYAPNEIWNHVCEKWEIICPSCFQGRCDELGINVIIKAEQIIK